VKKSTEKNIKILFLITKESDYFRKFNNYMRCENKIPMVKIH